MAKIVVSQFVSLDGVFEDPGGSEGWDRGGWAFKYDRGPEGDQFKLDEVMASDALLLGRVTYEGFAEAWPSRTGEFADKFNGMRKYVVSGSMDERRLEQLGRRQARRARRHRDASCAQEPGGDVLVNGSAQLVEALRANDLVDEYRLMVFPTVLGAGKRLFAGGGDASALRLVDAKPAGETLILDLRAGAGRAVIELTPIGRVESELTDRASAPKQGGEGAPDAWLVFEPCRARRPRRHRGRAPR